MIAACRAANSTSPAVAGKLRGLLGYVTGLSSNGRAALQPLSAHQYGHSCLSEASMDCVIRGIDRRPEKATVFIRRLMEASAASSPRPRSCRLLRFFPNGASMLAASPVPDRILAKLAAIKPRETYITSFEIMALCGVHFSIPYDQIRGAVFLHFGDNSGAIFFFVIKGVISFPRRRSHDQRLQPSIGTRGRPVMDRLRFHRSST